ncbi:MAG: hypothetical protein JOZ59_06920 [Candidatus Eremiobacteraeota bacterium]|nr:hypothetical protein [Candidatus Eremiobacteraeota bacterium]
MPVIRTVFVALLATFLLGFSLPDFIRVFGHPLYDFGYARNDAYIAAVAAGSPADRAGVRPGDWIDFPGTPPSARVVASVPGTIIPHKMFSISIVHEGQRRMVSMAADLREPLYREPLIVARELAMLVFVFVGVTLVLLRPSPMTWGFFLFCCAFNPAPYAVAITTLPFAITMTQQLLLTPIFSAGIAGLIVFALRFPTGTLHGWRIAAERIGIGAMLPLAAFVLWEAIRFDFIDSSTRVGSRILLTIGFVYLSVACVALLLTYFYSSGRERPRIRWLVVGSAAAIIASGFDNMIKPSAPYWAHASLEFLTILMPLSVAYAVIRHRVIDVSFVISRALVYAVLTTIIVAIFALIDWLLGRVLAQTRLALAAEVAAALGLGFWMNGLHRRIDQFIDRVLFRQRYLAAQRLARASAGLPHAVAETAVDEMLVNEPADALKLASAAVFRRAEDGFVRRASVNWPEDSMRSVPADEQLILLLIGEHGPMKLRDTGWTRADLPHGDREPALAVPVLVRNRLIAFALYGSHRNGEALDPSEAAALEQLAISGGVAYDHIEADQIRRENETLRAQLGKHVRTGHTSTSSV